MSLHVADAPELTLVLLGAFVKGEPPAAVVQELERCIWNNCIFGEAIELHLAASRIQDGSAGNFVYHQKSGLLFTHVSGGSHQLLMAYLASLHKIDFTAPNETWDYDQGYKFNATSKLADSFIEDGYGFFKSSVAKKNSILVGSGFPWTPLESRIFQDYAKNHLD